MVEGGDSEYWNFRVYFISKEGPDIAQEILFAYSVYYQKSIEVQTGFLKKMKGLRTKPLIFFLKKQLFF